MINAALSDIIKRYTILTQSMDSAIAAINNNMK